MCPSRLIVGEVRQAEPHDLLIGLHSGLPDNALTHLRGDFQTRSCLQPDQPGSQRCWAGRRASARRLHRACRPTQQWDVVGHHMDNDVSAYSGKPRLGHIARMSDLEAN